MATRLLFASVPKTHPNSTKPSKHRTPFSAVAASRFLHISTRLQSNSKTLETIYEEELMNTITNERIEGVADVLITTHASPNLPSAVSATSFKLSNRSSTCFVQMQKHLATNSDNFRCAYGGN